MKCFKQCLKLRLKTGLTLMGILLSVAVYAQQIAVTGTVSDEQGEAMPGVNVLIKGTTTGVVTDIDGKFSINVPDANTVLQVSFVGYTTQEITVGAQRIINVTLVEASTELDEVVVIGYGTARKGDLTGAVSSLNSKALEKIPVSSAAEAITGKMAGVQITTTEGSPDAEVKIRVRGGGSLTQDNAPLYIVDGFPVSSINDIAPSDIQSIDVLKDASSAAIYGARGANGVLIITTKSGTAGKTTVNFNAYWGARKITKYLDVLDPYEYVMLQAEIIGANETNFTRYFGNYNDIDLYKYDSGTDWQEELFGRSAMIQNYNLNLTGGGETSRYNLGLTHANEDGIMLNSGFSRTNVNFRYNNNIGERTSFEFNVRLAYTDVDGAGLASSGQSSSSRLKHAIQYRPTLGIASFAGDPDLELLEEMDASSSVYDPVMVANDDYEKQNRLRTNFNGAFNWDIVKNLKYRFEAGYSFDNNRTNRVYGPATSQSRTNGAGKPIANIKQYSGTEYRIANILTYDVRNIAEVHNLNVMIGQEVVSSRNKSTTMQARDFATTMTSEEILAALRKGTPETLSSNESYPNNLTSYFGRINYSYRDRYLATVTFRADGSSKFAPGNRWGYFPSAALAWRVSDEAFMTETKNWLSNLKLRFSLGMAGNNRIDDDLWKMSYATASSGKDYYLNEVLQSRLLPNDIMSNEKLKWETTITRNLGFDLGFFKHRLNATVDLYYNTTKDLLIKARIPQSTGYNYQMQNIGQTSNKGIELTVNGTIVETKDFSLSGSFNISFNRNNVDELGEEKKLLFNSGWYGNNNGPGDDYVIEEGQPLGQIYGYVYDGYYGFDDFTFDADNNKWLLNEGRPDNSAVSGASFFGPGAIKYKKIANDGSNTIGLEDDKIIIGDANPIHTGGFNLTATYKGFDFSAFFNWVYGNDIYNANKVAFTAAYDASARYRNVLDIMNSSNRFMYIDPTTGENLRNNPDRLAALNSNATQHSPILTRSRLTSDAIEDGSFLRLNNLTLGYTLPENLTKKFFVQRLRVYVTGYNLYTWTNYSGYDPEVDARRAQGPMTPGVDFSAYPRSRTFIGGINLTF